MPGECGNTIEDMKRCDERLERFLKERSSSRKTVGMFEYIEHLDEDRGKYSTVTIKVSAKDAQRIKEYDPAFLEIRW